MRADLDVVARSRVPERLRASATASATHKLAELDRLLLAPLGLSDEPLVVVPTADLSTLPWTCLPSLRRPAGRGRAHRRRVVVRAGAEDGAARRPGSSPSPVPGCRRPSRRSREVAADLARHAASSSGAAATRAGAGGGRAGRPRSRTSPPTGTTWRRTRSSPPSTSPTGRCSRTSSRPGRPAHVVLSACELGQATVRPGEESLGLTSVLLQLGARCVVVRGGGGRRRARRAR